MKRIAPSFLCTDKVAAARGRQLPLARPYLKCEASPTGGAFLQADGLDAESGLQYNYFRDYEPATGRYIESDPIGLEGGVTTYSYVEANPFRWSGLSQIAG